MSDIEEEFEENGLVDKKKLDEYGMPEMTEEEREKGYDGSKKFLCGVSIVPRLMCIGIAYLIYYFGSKDAYDKKIAMLSAQDYGWLYFGAFALSKTILWLNFFPMIYKSQIMKGSSGNIRANMMIFKVNYPEEEKQLPYVVMEEKDEIGMYNRANRSLFHFTESAAAVVLVFILAGLVFPFPVMVLMLVLSFGRIFHQIGYSGGYGQHGVGFAMAMFSHLIAEGLVLIAAIMPFFKDYGVLG
eukprot:gnl/MRDRNA2_/MRDRNA2_35988_c0_seq1.p1 gnl/MRDRNA2_/MRDRNA2_35988_c0~~gnl/MRDRNA2_/MRDRNA2_35988_c0_seq1.p1  ORF type:complete len:242 (-),score=49.81 gnl/MRDRNA2_/MRDRNA2_35988_c0_seq1:77-802(-)